VVELACLRAMAGSHELVLEAVSLLVTCFAPQLHSHLPAKAELLTPIAVDE
jgi:hypothetical protein